MIVTCEGCETSFHVQDHRIKSSGSKVRCSKCRHVFIAYPPAVFESEEPLILQEEVPVAEVSKDPARLNEIDFRLDELLREADADKADVPSMALEPEFLNVGDLLAEEAPAIDALATHRPGDDLTLDPGAGLKLEGPPEEAVAGAKATPQAVAIAPEESVIDFDLGAESALPAALGEPLPDVDELEINLDDLGLFDETGKPAAEAARLEDTPSSKFELDLDFDMLVSESADADRNAGFDSADTAGEERVVPSVLGMEDAELEFDLPLQEAALHQRTENRPLPASEDELDLSDLESILEGIEQGDAMKPVATEGIDLELDLQAVVAGEAPSDEMKELDLSDIVSPTDTSAASVDAATEELDFSSLAGILNEKAHAAGPVDAKAAVEEVSFIFEEPPQSERMAAEPLAPRSSEDVSTLDLEKLLEEDEDKQPEIPEIDLKATDEMDLRPASEPIRGSAGDLEIEIEALPDFDDSAGGQPSEVEAPTAVIAAAAAGAAMAAAAAAGPATIAAASDASFKDQFTPAGGATDGLVTEAEQIAAAAEHEAIPAEGSSRMRKLLFAAAALMVLALAALVIPRGLGIHVPYLRDIEVPFFGKIFQTEPEDTIGNLKVAVVQESISAEFIDNARAGRLCVIQGQVRNNYDQPRSFIRVTGKLYDNKKTVAKMTTVFAGNVLSKDELSAQEFGALSARLKNKNGADNLNVGVKPGTSIPFMIVFDGLPASLDEFSVEVAGSTN